MTEADNVIKLKLEKEKKRWNNIVGITNIATNQEGTKRIPVWKKNKSVLWYYPSPCKKYNIPVFHVYSLVNQPYILDLTPGTSLVEGFISNGYDVYLLDWGSPQYEDKDLTLEDYIVDYLHQAVKRALRYSNVSEISMIGYCLGGTLSAIYATIFQEPIRNLVLLTTPIDMSRPPVFDKWIQAIQKEELNLNPLIDIWGIIPAEYIKYGIRLVTSPIYFSQYFSLLRRAHENQYVVRWKLFNKWTNDHIPFSGALLRNLLDLAAGNKLINGDLQIKGKSVYLENITANLLVISTGEDRLVPEELSQPIMDKVFVKDKTYKHLKGGHVSLALKGRMPDVLQNWLSDRS
ncbi:alpha/beta fold hydrolase [Priestia filamentosa]|uniref:alpha/beta fold hydrolase n=1 Tax=Priestia filamentosa TaxID=1402861 RepID=UPI000A085A32|nr:alpha/beta fold hydrolase [Priestia filamentosa]OXS64683.1 hypothetical protein B1B01_25180 [Priestia filamentosa]SMF75154.1 polyhydroxyalkanoate synthase [Priestia filamentosa]